MIRRKLLIFLGILLFSVTASPEFYKYYDEQGDVHFTDDYNQVPMNQRKNVKEYKEIISDEVDREAPEKEAEPQAEGEQNPSTEAGKGGKYDFETKLKEFDLRKQEITQEYESLMAESAQLAREKEKAKSDEDIKKYNERVANLNKKIQEHDRKRKEFFAEVDAYNAKINEENARMQKKQAEKKEKNAGKQQKQSETE